MEKNDIELLIKAREAYYNSGHSILSDQEYDALEETLRQEHPNHPLFETIGHTPSSSWKKDSHRIFMGSLNKVHNKEDILKWSKKFGPSAIYNLQFKLDGLSASLNYDIEFINGITRGDGTEGEDISDNIRLMKGFKGIVPGFTGSVRAEIILPKKDFERINSILPEKDKYTNPRNAAAGISRRLDGRFCKYLHLITYDVTEELEEEKKIEKLNKMGFSTVKQAIGHIDKIIKAFEELVKVRSKLAFDIDGAVVKVDSYDIQQKYGVKSGRPKAQIAWKFDAPGAATVFKKEIWDVGRTGVVTPLALLEPIHIEGSTISKATLHNVAEIKRLGIGRGDLVRVEKRGDIIPKVTAIIEHKDEPIKIPTKCPSCNTDLNNDGIRLICPSIKCPQRNFYRVMNWIRVTGIEEFGESLGKKLGSKIQSISDLYKLKEQDISSIEGWGHKTAKTVIANINETRKLKPETFLTALGIPGISNSTSKELLKHFETIEKLLVTEASTIAEIEGFAETSASAIVSGFSTYRSEIDELLKIISLSSKEQKGVLYGKSFCFTGSMDQSRGFYQKLVEKHGGENKKSVTKDLSYLVCNEDKGSSKSRKAKKYDTEIINEKQFMELIGESVPESDNSKKAKIESYSLFE